VAAVSAASYFAGELGVVVAAARDYGARADWVETQRVFWRLGANGKELLGVNYLERVKGVVYCGVGEVRYGVQCTGK
jgi:hypothetical protein